MAPTSPEATCSRVILLFSEYEVNHPATSGVFRWFAAVAQDLNVVTTGIFQGVRQDRHPIERSLVVDGLCESDDIEGFPDQIERHGARVGNAEDVAEQSGSGGSFPDL